MSRSSSSARALDCFYTKPAIVQLCLTTLQAHTGAGALWLEPSAGTGEFLRRLPTPRLGLDVRPAGPEILMQDFLTWHPPGDAPAIVVVGNPPFGKNAQQAVNFFNHAAKFARTIAMIFPRTFKKPSVLNRLARPFALAQELALPPNAFIFAGKDYSVPCVFQIWQRTAALRPLVHLPRQHPDFEFTTPAGADFAVQRVGAHAGRIKHDFAAVSPNSHYYIKAHTAGVAAQFARLRYDDFRLNTAGNPSLAKGELVWLYMQAVADQGPRAK